MSLWPPLSVAAHRRPRRPPADRGPARQRPAGHTNASGEFLPVFRTGMMPMQTRHHKKQRAATLSARKDCRRARRNVFALERPPAVPPDALNHLELPFRASRPSAAHCPHCKGMYVYVVTILQIRFRAGSPRRGLTSCAALSANKPPANQTDKMSSMGNRAAAEVAHIQQQALSPTAARGAAVAVAATEATATGDRETCLNQPRCPGGFRESAPGGQAELSIAVYYTGQDINCSFQIIRAASCCIDGVWFHVFRGRRRDLHRWRAAPLAWQRVDRRDGGCCRRSAIRK